VIDSLAAFSPAFSGSFTAAAPDEGLVLLLPHAATASVREPAAAITVTDLGILMYIYLLLMFVARGHTATFQ
jgi:hypothetical protein